MTTGTHKRARPTAGIIAGCVLPLILLASTASAQGSVFAARTEGPPAEAIVALYSVSAGHTGPSAAQLLGQWAGQLGSGPEVTSDGRFVVWTIRPRLSPGSASGVMAAYDRATGAAHVFQGTSISQLIGDRSRPRIFARVAGAATNQWLVATADAETTVDLDTDGVVTGASGDGENLHAYGCTGTPRVCRFDVLSSTSGDLVRTVPLPPDTQRFAVASGGAVLYVVTGTTDAFILRQFDGFTGAETGSLPLPPRPFPLTTVFPGPMVVDDTRDRITMALTLYTTFPPGEGALWTVNTTNMTHVSQVNTVATPEMRLDEHDGTMVALSHPRIFGYGISGDCNPGTLQRVEVTTGQIQQTMTVSASACVAFALAQSPGAPQLLVPQVSDGAVSLEWTGADSPTSFVVEAGSGPGKPGADSRGHGPHAGRAERTGRHLLRVGARAELRGAEYAVERSDGGGAVGNRADALPSARRSSAHVKRPADVASTRRQPVNDRGAGRTTARPRSGWS